MNIQDILDKLDHTIAGKEQYLCTIRERISTTPANIEPLETLAEIVRINLVELYNIQNDLMQVRNHLPEYNNE